MRLIICSIIMLAWHGGFGQFDGNVNLQTADSILNLDISRQGGAKQPLVNLLNNKETTVVVIWNLLHCGGCCTGPIKELNDFVKRESNKVQFVTISVINPVYLKRKNLSEEDFWRLEKERFDQLKKEYNWGFENFHDDSDTIPKALHLESFPLIYVVKDKKTVLFHKTCSGKELIEKFKKL